MFSLSKKQPQPTAEEIIEEDNHFEEEQELEVQSEEEIFSDKEPEWESNLNWTEDLSWSKVMLSDAENMRQTGSTTRLKDTAMVVLVRRLENFPSVETIQKVRKSFESEINRLKSVKEAMKHSFREVNSEQNPTLLQAEAEVESELSKISVEKDSFENKIMGEVKIIEKLVENIVKHEKPRELVVALLKLYNFDENTGGDIYHMSTPILELTEQKDEEEPKDEEDKVIVEVKKETKVNPEVTKTLNSFHLLETPITAEDSDY